MIRTTRPISAHAWLYRVASRLIQPRTSSHDEAHKPTCCATRLASCSAVIRTCVRVSGAIASMAIHHHRKDRIVCEYCLISPRLDSPDPQNSYPPNPLLSPGSKVSSRSHSQSHSIHAVQGRPIDPWTSPSSRRPARARNSR